MTKLLRDLQEDALEAISIQALGQLGLAIENQTATLSIKRRLACEQLSYFAQAAAYYYHGLIPDMGTEPSSYINDVCCFLAVDELLTDNKKACLSFCLLKPATRAFQKLPELLDFALSLRPDDYKLPEIDTTWSCEEWETQLRTKSSISSQALVQGEELQLGLSIESQTTTLPIKRRLACEQLSYFAQDAERWDAHHHPFPRDLQEYLPIVLGLTRKEHRLDNTIEFKWKSLQDMGQESCIENSWFEVLSVPRMIAILLFLEANSLLAHKNLMDASERNASKDCKKDFIDLLQKACGYLEFCVNHIVGHLPKEIKTNLPRDLWEGVLDAISIQALGQGTKMQLGLAIESETATLSVKGRLAYEELSYFAQVPEL
ncbi:hypothetical protein GIB67_031114 [Kingdonia uniflora]|uniref:BRO1 domain-containing protein n=1 Tax=Kingdonia uniflora TaxID=39325 RepID=A0A7J7MED4_9MAGN|nr:hypothetical protein GIB67_031114 [Kingdonia uniflora]